MNPIHLYRALLKYSYRTYTTETNLEGKILNDLSPHNIPAILADEVVCADSMLHALVTCECLRKLTAKGWTVRLEYLTIS